MLAVLFRPQCVNNMFVLVVIVELTEHWCNQPIQPRYLASLGHCKHRLLISAGYQANSTERKLVTCRILLFHDDY